MKKNAGKPSSPSACSGGLVLFGVTAWLCGVLSGWEVDDRSLARDSAFNFVLAIILMNIAVVIGWILHRQNQEIGHNNKEAK